jgi:hypothetical protein
MFPLPLPKNFSLPLPLLFGSEKATSANAYDTYMTHIYVIGH